MAKNLVIESGKLRRADNVELANKITELREKKDPWLVIDEMVKAWEKSRPMEEKAYVVQVKDSRETLADSTFGQTTGGQDFERRLIMVFPIRLMKMIRTQYKPEELPMGPDFYREFARRYPKALIPDKM